MIFWNLVLQARLAYSAKMGKTDERKSKATLMQNLYKMEYTLLRDQWKQKFTEDHGTLPLFQMSVRKACVETEI